MQIFFSIVCIALGSFLGAVELEIDQNIKSYPDHISSEVWKTVEPYLIPSNHPVKLKLDSIFSKTRAIASLDTLIAAGFTGREPPSHSRAIVIRHKDIKGYIFKIYTDSKKKYYRGEPEYLTWMQRARGAKLVRDEIERQGWGDYFKAPRKWIYALPKKPKAKKGELQKNFILVEDEMDILPLDQVIQKWADGTVTTEHLDMLFHLVNATGLRGGCKFDNIPICKDGRMAFIDTQNNLKWPLPYERLFQVLKGELKEHWQALIKTVDQNEPPEFIVSPAVAHQSKR